MTLRSIQFIAVLGLLLAACAGTPHTNGRELPRLHPAEMALDDLTGIWWSGAEDGGRVRMVGERRGNTVDVRMIGLSSDGSAVNEHHTWTWDQETNSYVIIYRVGGVEQHLTGDLLPNGGITLKIPVSETIAHRNVFYSPVSDRLHIRQEIMDATGHVEENTRVLVREHPALIGPLTSTKPDVAQGALGQMGMPLEIRYEDGRTALPKKAHRGLDHTAKLLRLYPEVLLTIEGHDDALGDTEAAMSVAHARAADVAAYLGEAGVPAEQLDVQPYGDQLPLCSLDLATCHSRNRRVELRFGGLRESW